MAVADCLNYGDPSDPFVYHDFAESVKGISEVCRKMEIPVIAGNVSFHNLTYNGEDITSVIPTPVIGMVGILENHEDVMTVNFRQKGDMIYTFSDGYPDQFGGPNQKKFMIKNFKRMLQEIHMKSMEEQQLIMKKTLADWMAETDQIDDILVIGVRI